MRLRLPWVSRRRFEDMQRREAQARAQVHRLTILLADKSVALVELTELHDLRDRVERTSLGVRLEVLGHAGGRFIAA